MKQAKKDPLLEKLRSFAKKVKNAIEYILLFVIEVVRPFVVLLILYLILWLIKGGLDLLFLFP